MKLTNKSLCIQPKLILKCVAMKRESQSVQLASVLIKKSTFHSSLVMHNIPPSKNSKLMDMFAIGDLHGFMCERKKDKINETKASNMLLLICSLSNLLTSVYNVAHTKIGLKKQSANIL